MEGRVCAARIQMRRHASVSWSRGSEGVQLRAGLVQRYAGRGTQLWVTHLWRFRFSHILRKMSRFRKKTESMALG